MGLVGVVGSLSLRGSNVLIPAPGLDVIGEVVVGFVGRIWVFNLKYKKTRIISFAKKLNPLAATRKKNSSQPAG